MRKQLMLYIMLLSACALFGQDPAPGPGLEFKEEIKQTETIKLDWVHYIKAEKESLFVVSHRDGDINCFKRDLKTGGLTFIEAVDLNQDLNAPKRHLDAFPVLSEENILYASGWWTHAKGNQHSLGLSWYEYKAGEPKSKKLGHINCDAGSLHHSLNQNRLYLLAIFSKAIYEIDLDPKTGKPGIGQKVSGQGIGRGLLQTPDGKHCYSLDPKASHIGWCDISKEGSLKYSGSQELKPLNPKPPRAAAIGISPDGAYVYVALWTYGYNALGLFKRNQENGSLTFVENIQVDKRMQKITRMVFRSDGKAGYYSSGPESSGNCLGWFTRNPENGKLTFGGIGKHSKGKGPGQFEFCPDTGAIYMAGTWSTKSFWIYSVPPDK